MNGICWVNTITCDWKGKCTIFYDYVPTEVEQKSCFTTGHALIS